MMSKGLMNIQMACFECGISMRVFKGKIGDETIEFKCPKCGDVEQRTAMTVQDMITEASSTGEALCHVCVNNKMCEGYLKAIRQGMFVTKCTHYIERSVGND